MLAPQALAVRNPERAALLLLPYVSVLQAIIGPPLTVLYWVARPLAHVLDGGREAGHYITEEEMRQLVDPDDEDNVIPAEEEDMIQQIFEFSDTVARRSGAAHRHHRGGRTESCRWLWTASWSAGTHACPSTTSPWTTLSASSTRRTCCAPCATGRRITR